MLSLRRPKRQLTAALAGRGTCKTSKGSSALSPRQHNHCPSVLQFRCKLFINPNRNSEQRTRGGGGGGEEEKDKTISSTSACETLPFNITANKTSAHEASETDRGTVDGEGGGAVIHRERDRQTERQGQRERDSYTGR